MCYLNKLGHVRFGDEGFSFESCLCINELYLYFLQIQVKYGHLKPPKSPLLRHVIDPEGELSRLLDGYDVFERQLKYRFQDRSYLLQAMTHASYSPNRLTDCYQRLEFLGDAVLGTFHFIIFYSVKSTLYTDI